MALMALGLTGCATRRATSARGDAARQPLRLAPVRVSWDRIIRATVGLRPHRPSGFVLRAEKLDAKTLIHNYGHGGCRDVAVVGHGADGGGAGARAARSSRGRARLRRRGADDRAPAAAPRVRRHDLRRGGAARHDVEHVAGRLHADLGPGASATAHAGVGRAVPARRRDRVSPAAAAGRAEVRHLVDLQLRARPTSRRNRRVAAQSRCCPTRCAPGSSCSARASIRFRSTYAIERPEMRIEPSIYLDALVQDVVATAAES